MGGKLSKKQNLVLSLLTEKFLTVKDISKVCHTSLRAVYKTIQILRKKGYLDCLRNPVVIKTDPTTPPLNSTTFDVPSAGQQIRLHNMHFIIKLLHAGRSFRKHYTGKQMRIDGHMVKFHQKNIEIQQAKGSFWIAPTEDQVEKLAYDYWTAFFLKLQSQLPIIIIKGENSQIRQVNAHYAHINHGMAYDHKERHEKLRLVDKRDGKVWLEVDFSPDGKGFELEFKHPVTASQDSRKIGPYIQDWRDNKPFNNSEIMIFLKSYGFDLPDIHKKNDKKERPLTDYFG